MRNYLVLAAFVVGCLAIGSLGGFVTMKPVLEWYPTLAKPTWTPPSWVFGPVWTVLYIMIAVAGWLVFEKEGFRQALIVWVISLQINAAWSVLMFKEHQIALAAANIVALLVSIVIFISLTWKTNRLASLLFVPYLVWVSYATALNIAIWQLNPGQPA